MAVLYSADRIAHQAQAHTVSQRLLSPQHVPDHATILSYQYDIDLNLISTSYQSHITSYQSQLNITFHINITSYCITVAQETLPDRVRLIGSLPTADRLYGYLWIFAHTNTDVI